MAQVKAQFKRRSTANNVEIYVPVPEDADSPKFRVRRLALLFYDRRLTQYRCIGFSRNSALRTGEVCVRLEDQAIGRSERIPHASSFRSTFGARRSVLDHSAVIDCSLFRWSIEEMDKRAPMTVKFEIPYFTVSGIQVRYLKIVEKSGYQALPWVRYAYFPLSSHRQIPLCRSRRFEGCPHPDKSPCVVPDDSRMMY